jgi:hypothetical protein
MSITNELEFVSHPDDISLMNAIIILPPWNRDTRRIPGCKSLQNRLPQKARTTGHDNRAARKPTCHGRCIPWVARGCAE